jgi:tetratricopeptide (TPR) repeat protein
MLKDMRKRIRNNIAFITFSLAIAFITINTLPAFSQMVDEQYLAGCAYFIKGDYSNAAESFSLAIMHNNADEQLYMKRGESLLKVNDVDRAVADFNEANILYPDVADLWLARSYAVTGDKDKSILFLKKHLGSAFRLPEDSIKRDPAFDKLQVTPEWFSLWQQDWYSDTEKVTAEVNYYVNKKLYDRAIGLLDNEVAKSPMNVNLALLRGNIYLQQGNYAAAVADFSTALDMDKSASSVYSQRGLAFLKAGRYKDAIGDFNKALKEEPGNFKLYIQRAEAYAAQNSWGSAIKDISFYRKYFENDLQALYQCGEYYFESEDYINALKCFNRNLKEDPNNGLYYKARGKTYLKTFTYRYALSDMSMSLDLRPEDAETWMYLGIARIQSGDKENGCSDLEKAQKMGNTQAIKYILKNCR